MNQKIITSTLILLTSLTTNTNLFSNPAKSTTKRNPSSNPRRNPVNNTQNLITIATPAPDLSAMEHATNKAPAPVDVAATVAIVAARTPANTANQIVQRNGNGSFFTNEVNANVLTTANLLVINSIQSATAPSPTSIEKTITATNAILLVNTSPLTPATSNQFTVNFPASPTNGQLFTIILTAPIVGTTGNPTLIGSIDTTVNTPNPFNYGARSATFVYVSGNTTWYTVSSAGSYPVPG